MSLKITWVTTSQMVVGSFSEVEIPMWKGAAGWPGWAWWGQLRRWPFPSVVSAKTNKDLAIVWARKNTAWVKSLSDSGRSCDREGGQQRRNEWQLRKTPRGVLPLWDASGAGTICDGWWSWNYGSTAAPFPLESKLLKGWDPFGWSFPPASGAVGQRRMEEGSGCPWAQKWHPKTNEQYTAKLSHWSSVSA